MKITSCLSYIPKNSGESGVFDKTLKSSNNMKKARTIKIIKSGSAQHAQISTLPLASPQAKYEKSRSVKNVESWVNEHQEQKLVAERVALLLYVSANPKKINEDI
jgi:hypothetical protein